MYDGEAYSAKAVLLASKRRRIARSTSEHHIDVSSKPETLLRSRIHGSWPLHRK